MGKINLSAIVNALVFLARLLVTGLFIFFFAVFVIVLAGEAGVWVGVLAFVATVYASGLILKYALTRY